MGLTRIRAEQISDIDYKQSVRTIELNNVTLSGGAPSQVDGVSLNVGDRVLVTSQDTASQNGLYDVTVVGSGSNGTWVRTSDANATGEINAGMIVMVTEGSIYADTSWKLVTNDPIVIGTTALSFLQNTGNSFSVINAAGTNILANGVSSTVNFVAGNNITITGNATTDTITFDVSASDYGNANVAAYLPTYTGVITASDISASGNITGGNIITSGASGNISGANVISAVTITASGNITGSYFIGDGSQLTNLPIGDYGNANVAAYLPTYTGDITANNISATSNVVAATFATSGAQGNIVGANIVSAVTFTATGNIYTDSYFVGNGFGITDVANINSGTSTLGFTAPDGNIVGALGGVYGLEITPSTVSIGYAAGVVLQGANAVALGTYAGFRNQGAEAISIGAAAGNWYQGIGAISIGGDDINESSQGNNAVSIGYGAGTGAQGANAVAIGAYAGATDQGEYTIAIGNGAGGNAQGIDGIAIGDGAAVSNQSANAIAFGTHAGAISQNANAIAIGTNAGYDTQGNLSIAIGLQAGRNLQLSNAIAIGFNSGNSAQQDAAIAIGLNAGNITQGESAIAIGRNAGNITQGANAISFGRNAGNISQGINAIAIGKSAGNISQGNTAVALGHLAGADNQGANAVAIGAYAGYPISAENSIAINGSSGNLPAPNAGFYVNPVRNDTGNVNNVVYFNTDTYELTYGPVSGGSYGNANVAAYLPTYTGVITGSDLSTTGNVSGANIVSAVTVTAIGNIYSDSYFIGNGSQLTGISSTGTVIGGNLLVYTRSAGALDVAVTAGYLIVTGRTGNIDVPLVS